jgi:hypothetical protein
MNIKRKGEVLCVFILVLAELFMELKKVISGE